MRFLEFVTQKEQEIKKHLELVKALLEQAGLKTTEKLDGENPFIFVHHTGKTLPFDGVRVYQIGDSIAFRPQKDPASHPFGKAVSLEIEQLFDTLNTGADNMDENAIVQKVSEYVKKELDSFFRKCQDSEKGKFVDGDYNPRGFANFQNSLK